MPKKTKIDIKYHILLLGRFDSSEFCQLRNFLIIFSLLNIHASCTSLVVILYLVNKLDMVRVSYTSSKYFCSMDYNLIDLKGNLTIKKGNLLRLSKRRTSNPTIQVKKRNSVIDSVFLDLTITFLQLLSCNESSQLMLIPPLHVVKPMVLVNLVSKLGPQVCRSTW